MSLISALQSLQARLGLGPAKRPPTRLSEAESVAIAQRVLGRDEWLVGEVASTPSGLVWNVETLTIGSGEAVRLSDATGEIIERQRWGLR